MREKAVHCGCVPVHVFAMRCLCAFVGVHAVYMACCSV